MIVIRIAAALALSVLALSACGLKGNVQRPVPLWGNPPDEGAKDPRRLKAQKEQADAEKAQKKADQEKAREQRAAEQAAAPAATPSPQ